MKTKRFASSCLLAYLTLTGVCILLQVSAAVAEDPRKLQLCEFSPDLTWESSAVTGLSSGRDVTWLSGNFLRDNLSQVVEVDRAQQTLQLYRIDSRHFIPVGPRHTLSEPVGEVEFRVGDVNGDGVDEIVAYRPHNGEAALWILKPESIEHLPLPQRFPKRSRRWEVGDFDCDSYADLLFDANGYRIYRGDSEHPFARLREFVVRWRLLGAIQPLADGCARGLVEQEASIFRILHVPKEEEDPPHESLFAHFLAFVSPELVQYTLTGDFNADSLEDLLLYRNRGLSEWSIAYSSGVSGLEFTGKGPPLVLTAGARLLVGRFDEQPGSDLLYLPEMPQGPRLFSPRAQCTPKDGVTLLLNELELETDEQGTVVLAQQEAATLDVQLRSPGLRVFPKQVALNSPERNLRLWSLPLGRGIDYYGWTIGHPEDGFEPTVCSGYIHESLWRKWGNSGDCPEGYAILTIGQPSRHIDDASKVPVQSRCCRIPSDLFEADSIITAPVRCPDGHLSTGGSDPYIADLNVHELECRKVNQKRYALGAAHSGLYWGIASNYFHEPNRVDIEKVPLALQFGMRRTNTAQFDADGCIGSPWGALLVEKGAGTCSKLKYRAVYERTGVGVQSEKPLQYWPQCRAIEGSYTPIAACVKE